jgi:hypothetical protein
LLLQHGARSPAFLIGLALIVVDLLIDVLIRLIESRPLKGLWKRFREVSATGENADPLRSTVNRFVLVAMWFFVSLAAAWSTGYSRARDQRSFLVTDLSQEQVVLRRYGDVLLLADLDEERKVVSRHFTLESIGGDPSRIFVSANVGPLVSDAER